MLKEGFHLSSKAIVRKFTTRTHGLCELAPQKSVSGEVMFLPEFRKKSILDSVDLSIFLFVLSNKYVQKQFSMNRWLRYLFLQTRFHKIML